MKIKKKVRTQKMSKKNEVLQATNTVIEKGNDFLGKAKDFIACVELLLVAATGFKSMYQLFL